MPRKTILESDHESRFVPKEIYFLVCPIGTFGTQGEVEVVQQLAQDQTHFTVCQTGQISMCVTSGGKTSRKGTHFFPRQFLGPKLKGCRTSFLSLSNRASIPSQRSGIKSSGNVKLDEE